MLEDAIDDLRRKVHEVGISLDPEGRDVATMRGWRASLEAHHSQNQRGIARLFNLAKDAARLPETRAELARLRQQIAKNEQELAMADEQRAAAEKGLQVAELQLAEVITKRTEAQAQTVLLAVC